jgi:small multidrug resistance family-3 protein
VPTVESLDDHRVPEGPADAESRRHRSLGLAVRPRRGLRDRRGWLVWKWLRDHKPGWWGLLGGLVLILYGIIPTLQASHFGRVYAAYGGFFIVLSLLWGWGIDGDRPDSADVTGACIALVGVCVMMYWRRR